MQPVLNDVYTIARKIRPTDDLVSMPKCEASGLLQTSFGKTTVSVRYSLPNYVLTYLSLYGRFFSNVKLDYLGFRT